MSAALIDLVSKGAQDVYITGQPEASFFRQNYKRHTNFSIKPERIDYIGSFAANSEVTIPIKSKGDLLSYVWIESPGISAAGNNTTGLFSSNAEPTDFMLYIGGQQVCKLDSLYVQGVHNVLYNETQAQASTAVSTAELKENATNNAGTSDQYVIPFFFSQDWTKCLPLVGMQYHDVEIRIKCRGDGFSPSETPKVYAMYAYLDTEERKFFTEGEHEILITQTQYQPASKEDTEFDLTYFNHPTKAIHVVSSNTAAVSNWDVAYGFSDATLYINGTPLFENMSKDFHHSVVPKMHSQFLPDNLLQTAPVYTWPFCLNIGRSQPSGSLNFSRIDTAKLAVRGPYGGGKTHRVYGVNYNILRIKNGMAGVAFGN
jgi:hypothetical protein